MTTEELTQKVTNIIKSMKVDEVKRFRSGVEVFRDKYTVLGYSVVSADGQESKSGLTLESAINFVIDSYR